MGTLKPIPSGTMLVVIAVLSSLLLGEPWSSAGAGTYGPGIGGDALGNSTIGGPVGAKKFFLRFRAAASSPLLSVTFPFVSTDYPGYGAGTGGEWKLELRADDGSLDHFPTGAPLATQLVAASTVSSLEREISFAPAYTTTKGVIYHLVFENVDAAPTVNYFSVNNWVRLSFTEGGQLNPRFPATDWGNGFFHAGSWHNNPASCSIADIAYGNGKHQGMCYGEASYACPPDHDPCVSERLVGEINGPTKMVRERFALSCGSRTVLGVGVRVLKIPGTTSDLAVSLRNSADVEIDSVRLSASSVATGPAPEYNYPPSWDDVGQNARWVTGSFSKPLTLNAGETYYLRLSSPGGTYWAWVMRRLSAEYSYSAATAFGDGWSEYTADGSTWHSLGRVELQNDVQFFLVTPCAADFNGDQKVDGADLSVVLGSWGAACPCSCPGDFNEDGVVNGGDLSLVLALWGPCP